MRAGKFQLIQRQTFVKSISFVIFLDVCQRSHLLPACPYRVQNRIVFTYHKAQLDRLPALLIWHFACAEGTSVATAARERGLKS